jgi:hypothetical protein
MNKILLSSLILLVFACRHSTVNTLTEKNQVSKSDSILLFDSMISIDKLNYSSLEFLQLAINGIYANHGMIFKDSCFQKYFNSQIWYNPTAINVDLSKDEQTLITLLDSIRTSRKDSQPIVKIITKLRFDNKPLFYVASKLMLNYYGKFKYRAAHFYLLDSTYLWTLNCPSIAPEFIIKKAIKSLWCIDDGKTIISPEDIKIINFDSLCINGHKPEILIRLYGPSNDDGHYLIGYDSKGNFGTLIEGHFIDKYHRISDSIVRFTSVERCDRIGTEFCKIDYNYNTITKKVEKITKPKYKHTIKTSTLDTVFLFKSYFSAINQDKDSISLIISPNKEVSISSYLDKPKGFLVVFLKENGWISYEQLHKFRVSFAD